MTPDPINLYALVQWMSPNLINLYALVDVTKPYKFVGFCDSYGPRLYKIIWFGDSYGPKPGLLPGKNRNRASGRPKAGWRADVGVFSVAVRPKSGTEGRFTAWNHYCVTLSFLFKPWHPIRGRIEGHILLVFALAPESGRIEAQAISSLTGPRLPIRWRSEAQTISSLFGPGPR